MMRDRDGMRAPTDAALEAMFDRRGDRADAVGLRGPILAAAGSARQRRRWPVVLPVPMSPWLIRATILALIAIAITGLVLIGSGAFRPRQAPTGTAAGFVRPFEYAIPAHSTLHPSIGEPRREVIAWVEGPDHPPNPDSLPSYGGQNVVSDNLGGIIVASAAQAWSHGPSERFMLRTAPAELIADLRDTAMVPMGPIRETTLDGHPALTVMLVSPRLFDIHVNGPITSLSQDFVLLTAPSRLTVADVDGTPVFVLIWAHTAADMEALTPVADEFVTSIHFLPADRP
jgi:hypothetical protein